MYIQLSMHLKFKLLIIACLFVCLFLGLISLSAFFSVNPGQSSPEPTLTGFNHNSGESLYLAQEHNMVPPVRIEPRTFPFLFF